MQFLLKIFDSQERKVDSKFNKFICYRFQSQEVDNKVAIASSPFASSSSKVLKSFESKSMTATTTSFTKTGTTTSEFDAESHAMCPGNLCFSISVEQIIIAYDIRYNLRMSAVKSDVVP